MKMRDKKRDHVPMRICTGDFIDGELVMRADVLLCRPEHARNKHMHDMWATGFGFTNKGERHDRS